MKLPQFSLQRLMIGFTLIAVGVFMAVRIFRHHLWTEPIYFIQWFLSGALIFAGLLTPLQRPILGAVIGLVVTAIVAGTILVIAMQNLNIR